MDQMNLRVVSWNIHKGRDAIGRVVDIQHSLDLLVKQDWDVCLLQEAPKHALHLFANRSGCVFAFGHTRSIRAEMFGNAILVKNGTVAHEKTLDISAHPIESRGALVAEVALASHPDMAPILAVSTHFGLARHWRVRQAKRLMQYLREHGGDSSAMVLGGDFNDRGHEISNIISAHGFELALASGRNKPAASFPAMFPMLSLDAIYAKNAKISSSAILGSQVGWHRHSDHLPLIATANL